MEYQVQTSFLNPGSQLNPVGAALFAPPPPPPPNPPPDGSQPVVQNDNSFIEGSYQPQNQSYNTWQSHDSQTQRNSSDASSSQFNGSELNVYAGVNTQQIPAIATNSATDNLWPLQSTNSPHNSMQPQVIQGNQIPAINNDNQANNWNGDIANTNVNNSSTSYPNFSNNMQQNRWNESTMNSSIIPVNVSNNYQNNNMQNKNWNAPYKNNSSNVDTAAGYASTCGSNDNSWGNSMIDSKSTPVDPTPDAQMMNSTSQTPDYAIDNGDEISSYNQSGYMSTRSYSSSSQLFENNNYNSPIEQQSEYAASQPINVVNQRCPIIDNDIKEPTAGGCAYEHCFNDIALGDFHSYCLNHRACFTNGQIIPCQSCNITFTTLLDSEEAIHPIYNVWHNLIKKLKKRRLRTFGDQNIWRNDDDERNFTLPCEPIARAICLAKGCNIEIMNGDRHSYCLSHRYCVDEYYQLTPCEYCVTSFRHITSMRKVHPTNHWTFLLNSLRRIRNSNFNMDDVWKFPDDEKYFVLGDPQLVEDFVVKIREPIPIKISELDGNDVITKLNGNDEENSYAQSRNASDGTQYISVLASDTCSKLKCESKIGFGDHHKECVRHRSCINKDFQMKPCKYCLGNYRNMVAGIYQYNYDVWKSVILHLERKRKSSFNDVQIWVDPADEEYYTKMAQPASNLWAKNNSKGKDSNMDEQSSQMEYITVPEKLCSYKNCKTRVTYGDFHNYCLNHRTCFEDGKLIPCDLCKDTFMNLKMNETPYHSVYNVWNNLVSLLKLRRKRTFGDDNIWTCLEDEKYFELSDDQPKQYDVCKFTDCTNPIMKGDLHPFCMKHRTCFRDGKLIPCKYCEFTFKNLLLSHDPIHPLTNAWTSLIIKLKKRRKKFYNDENIWLSEWDKERFTLSVEVNTNEEDKTKEDREDFSVYDLFGKDMVVSTQDLDDVLVPIFSRAWENKTCMVVCHPAYDSLLDTSSLSSSCVAHLTNIVKHHLPEQESNSKIDMQFITERICIDLMHTKNVDYMIVLPFLAEFTEISESNQLCFTSNHESFEHLFHIIVRLETIWKLIKPRIQILWALPYAPDFERLNSKDSEVDQTFKHRCIAESRFFYKKMGLFAKEWKQRIPDVHFINLASVFFEKTELEMMTNKSIPIIWPENYTSDGLSPTDLLSEKIWQEVYIAFFKIFRSKFFKGSRMMSDSDDEKLKIPKPDYRPKLEDDSEDEWLLDKVCIIGDSTVEDLVHVRGVKLPNVDLIIKDLAAQPFPQFIYDVDVILLENDYDILVLSPFHGKTIITYLPESTKDQIHEGLVLQKPRPIDMTLSIPTIHKATLAWKRSYPAMKVIWVLPIPINFMLKNTFNIARYEDHFSGLFDHGQYTLDKRKENYHSVVYYIKVVNLVREWLNCLPDVAMINLLDLYLEDRQKVTFVDTKENISWPVGYTWNGMNILPKFSNLFWKQLENLRNGMDDAGFIQRGHYHMSKRMARHDINEDALNHPLYSFMWERFWGKHSAMLKSVDIDFEKYDFTHEWNYRWRSFGRQFREIHYSFTPEELQTRDFRFRFTAFMRKTVLELEIEGKEISAFDFKQHWHEAEQKRFTTLENERLEKIEREKNRILEKENIDELKMEVNDAVENEIDIQEALHEKPIVTLDDRIKNIEQKEQPCVDRESLERIERERLERLEKERFANHEQKRLAAIEKRRLMLKEEQAVQELVNAELQKIDAHKNNEQQNNDSQKNDDDSEIIMVREAISEKQLNKVDKKKNKNINSDVIDVNDVAPWDATGLQIVPDDKLSNNKKPIIEITLDSDDKGGKVNMYKGDRRVDLSKSIYSPFAALRMLSDFVNHLSFLAPSVINLNRQASKRQVGKAPMQIFENRSNVTIIQVALVLLDCLFLSNKDNHMSVKIIDCIQALNQLLSEIGAPVVSKESLEILKRGAMPGEEVPNERYDPKNKEPRGQVGKFHRRDMNDKRDVNLGIRKGREYDESGSFDWQHSSNSASHKMGNRNIPHPHRDQVQIGADNSHFDNLNRIPSSLHRENVPIFRNELKLDKNIPYGCSMRNAPKSDRKLGETQNILSPPKPPQLSIPSQLSQLSPPRPPLLSQNMSSKQFPLEPQKRPLLTPNQLIRGPLQPPRLPIFSTPRQQLPPERPIFTQPRPPLLRPLINNQLAIDQRQILVPPSQPQSTFADRPLLDAKETLSTRSDLPLLTTNQPIMASPDQALKAPLLGQSMAELLNSATRAQSKSFNKEGKDYRNLFKQDLKPSNSFNKDYGSSQNSLANLNRANMEKFEAPLKRNLDTVDNYSTSESLESLPKMGRIDNINERTSNDQENSEIWKDKNSEIQKGKNSEIQKDDNSEIQKDNNSEIQKDKNSGLIPQSSWSIPEAPLRNKTREDDSQSDTDMETLIFESMEDNVHESALNMEWELAPTSKPINNDDK